jgi:hypothetical protein
MLAAGCGPKKGGSAGSPPCEAYVACLQDADASTLELAQMVYGPDGTCFSGGKDPDACHAACALAHDAAAVQFPDVETCAEGSPKGDTEGDTGEPPQDGIAISIARDVDVLFVIDNSGSMGEEQQNLAANFASFLNVLERDEVGANYRIGITTTDNGNPICQGTTPEGGNLVFSSCRSRLGEFTFTGAAGEVDAQSACTDFCGIESIDTLPTVTAFDSEAKSRPWIEVLEGTTNLPAGLDTLTAFQCLSPQGIGGCGFESPLESMYKALLRSAESGDRAEGFLRDDAVLAIVFLTDEVDCSHNNDQNDAFLPSGNRVFWSVPDAESPTSAVCWNAGVECTGSSPYGTCRSIDYDVEGNPLYADSAAEEAVLRPVQRYVEFVAKIEEQKQLIHPTQGVLVAAISGVPQGYAEGTAEIEYRDSPAGTPYDPYFQENFGIGPGCMGNVAEAVPPVRLREFADVPEEGTDTRILECADATGTLPTEADVCYVERTGDDLSSACAEDGWNLEFRIVRKQGVHAPAGAQVGVECALSSDPAVDCPNLPD